jgi:hypothetical protein
MQPAVACFIFNPKRVRRIFCTYVGGRSTYSKIWSYPGILIYFLSITRNPVAPFPRKHILSFRQQLFLL